MGHNYILTAEREGQPNRVLKTFEDVGLGEAQEQAEDLIIDWEDEHDEWEYEDNEEPFASGTLPGLNEGDNIVLKREDGKVKYLYTDGWEDLLEPGPKDEDPEELEGEDD